MKNFYILLLLIFASIFTYSQENTGISYQALIVDSQGESLPGFDNVNVPLSNKDVCIKFSIVNNQTNTVDYSERQSLTTNEFGIVDAIIGSGTPLSSNVWSDVEWSAIAKRLIVEVDISNGCVDYSLLSDQLLNYVPFALYAENSGNQDFVDENKELIDALTADVDQNEADSDASDVALQSNIDALTNATDTAIAALQADVDQNESDSDAAEAANAAAIAATQADVDQNEADADAAIAALQADVDQNESDSDAAEAANAAAIAATQADVDQNEADADAAIAALQADVDQNESDSDAAEAANAAAIAATQADVDQNEADADAAIAALQADVDQNESDSDAAEAANAAAIAATQADVDQNEADADAAIAALQADVDQNESDSDAAEAANAAAIAATQADVDQNEADADAAIAALQADVDQNESDSDAAEAANAAAIAATQADVDQNEADADAAIAALQADVDQNESDSDAAEAANATAIAAEIARATAAEAANAELISELELDDLGDATSNATSVFIGSPSTATTSAAKNNTSLGKLALDAVAAGFNNTAVGYNSLSKVTSGKYNVGIGNGAGLNIIGGSSNTFIGNNTNTLTGQAGASNRTVIGAGAIGSQNNSVVLGNNTVTQIWMSSDKGATIYAGGLNLNGSDLSSTIEELNFTTGVTSSIQTQINNITTNVSSNDNDIAANTTAIAAVQADVDQNESDTDAAIAALQADVDQNESDADAAIAATQADVDQNEADADAAIAALQADVNINETDSDNADATLQSAIDTKQDIITGGASTITSDNLSANFALLSNSNGKVAVSAVTATELSYLDGVTSAIQTQIDNLLNKIAALESDVATLQQLHVPEITLLGDASVSVGQSSGDYDDAGATANDLNDGDITSSIVTVNPVQIGTVGSYTVTYNVTDSDGNAAAEVTRTVNVIDDVVPVITLTGDTPVTVEVGSTYTDAGATATDNLDGDITNSIVVVNSVNTTKLGTYTVTYNVADSNGNAAVEVTRTVNVVDTTKPVITVSGTNPDTAEASPSTTTTQTTRVTHTDASVYITQSGGAINIRDDKWSLDESIDTKLHELNGTLLVNGSQQNNVLYTITGRKATGTYIKYYVNPNPSFVTNGNRSITTTYDVTTTNTETEEYDDSGATASDNYDGDITSDIVTVNNVNRGTVGTYTVTYNVTDSSGNSADQKTRTVNVVDTTSPVITLVGSASLNVDSGSDYNDAGATASDSFEGNLTTSIVTVNPVNTSLAGSYTITYNVTDSSGNAATEVTRTVNVVDATPPVITGSQNVNVNENETSVGTYTANESVTWSLSGVDSSKFSVDNNSGAIVFSSAPNYEAPTDSDSNNIYALTLTAADSSGNESSLNISITVVNVVEAFDSSAFSIQGTITTTTTATINWTYSGEGVEGYFLWVRIGRGGSWNPVTVFKQNLPDSAGLTSYTIGGLTPGTTYSFRLWPLYNGGTQCKNCNNTREPLFTTQQPEAF